METLLEREIDNESAGHPSDQPMESSNETMETEIEGEESEDEEEEKSGETLSVKY